MTVENSKSIDFVGVERESGDVVLTVSNHLEWSCDHLPLLQAKLNAYIVFVESGELIETYKAATGRKVRIDVACRFEPDEAGRRFLAQVKTALSEIGIGFRYVVGLDAIGSAR
jgi:hypothetical protein